MKVLVLGSSGMLGSDVVAELSQRGHDVRHPSSRELDITDPMSVASIAMSPGTFDWCINCAAYTAVDKAESDIQAATELNMLGPGYLSNACSMSGTKLVHISTDFVFNGEGTSPYREDSPTDPLGVYGSTKRDGELAVLGGNTNALVVRTSWLYGPLGRSFPKTMIGAWRAGKTLRVVNDQVGCPTYTVDLARVLVDMIDCNAYPGVYHACGPTVTNWHAFAVESISRWATVHGNLLPIEVAGIPTSEYPTPANRPHYSVLSCGKLAEMGIAPMRDLPTALNEFVTRVSFD